MMRLLFLLIGLMSVSLSTVYAQETAPGDACTAGETNFIRQVGGPETNGIVNLMRCNGTNWQQYLTIDDNGRVGVGTSSPTSTLELGDDNGDVILTVDSSSFNNINNLVFRDIPFNRNKSILWERQGGRDDARITGSAGSSGSNSELRLSAGADNTRFVLEEMGRDANTSVAANLTYSVNKPTSGDDYGLVIRKVNTASTGISRLIEGRTGGVTQFWINDEGTGYLTGNLGIGIDNPQAALDVSGNIFYTGTLRDVSDIRQKKS